MTDTSAAQPNPEFFRGYPIRTETWSIAGRTFELSWVADMDILLDHPETHRRHNQDGYMPYWGQPWPGAILLTEAVLRGEPGHGRPAVEIGAGIGLTGLAAAAMGWQVVVSDYDDDALAYAQLNAQRNGLTFAGLAYIDYREPLAEPAYDLILGADLLYERAKSAPIARWIASALKPGGRALLSDPNRSAADGFPEEVRAVGLNIEVQPAETVGPSGLTVRGRIFVVTHS